MVVLVLMTSCHVSLNPNSGPVSAHATITRATPARTLMGLPDACAVHFVSRVNQLRLFVGRIIPPLSTASEYLDRAHVRAALRDRVA